MKKVYWFEVFISKEEEGTETIETFDTLCLAEQYVSDNCEQDLYIDKWTMNEQGGNVKINI